MVKQKKLTNEEKIEQLTKINENLTKFIYDGKFIGSNQVDVYDLLQKASVDIFNSLKILKNK